MNPYYKPRAPKPCPSCGEFFAKAKPQEVYCSLHCAIWPRIKQGDPDECWLWLGGLAMGYGAGTFHKRRYKVSRVVLGEKLGRELTNEEQALHRCDTPACCNPAHLFVGTGADNMADKVSKGRQRNGTADLRGERHPLAKLTEEDVKYIWSHRHTQRQVDLAKRFGVERGVIFKVIKGRSWSSITKNLP